MSAPVVLLVEDDENDEFIFRRAFRKACPSCMVYRVTDGQSAMHYLSGTGPYSNREEYPFPLVVVLDLVLLTVPGLEVLAWARQQPQFTDLPIVVLTGSIRPGDEQRARELGAVQFFEKGPDYSRVVEYVQTLLGQKRVAGK